MINVSQSDIRIKKIDKLASPEEIAALYPLTENDKAFIKSSRSQVNAIIKGEDRRLLAVIGPCSIHDPEAAIEYATKLKKLSDEVKDQFHVVMRTYFEKPRTVLGWKGLILDPDMDDEYNIEKGLKVARKLLLEINRMGLPVGCEFLDPIIPQYIDELMSWASIGARTTESQTHRSMASGLSVAVGFKNSTSGEVDAAIYAAKSASYPASFIGVEKNGMIAVFRSKGNDSTHLILRGGVHGPNYYEDIVESTAKRMIENKINPAIVIDCSHSNSRKDYTKQKRVLRSVIDQVQWGEKHIRGFMLESNLFEGNQTISDDISTLKYGVSVTDACIGWDETEKIVSHAAEILRKSKEVSEIL